MTDVAETAPARGPAVARDGESWDWLFASGVLGVLLGTLALLVPALTVVGAALALGCGLLALGGLEIGAALRSGAGRAARVWLAVLGVATFAAGALVVLRPLDGVLALVAGLVLWFVALGVHDLAVAASRRDQRGWNVALGVWSLAVAVALCVWPSSAVATLALLVALGFLLRGGASIGLALTLRRAAREGRRP